MSTTPNVARDDGPWLQLRVSAREIAAESVVRFELRHPDGLPLPPFSAGSHIDLRLPNGTVRQYSLCNDPAERSRYEIGILLDPASRGGSRSAHADIALGDLIAVGAPRNLFPLHPAEHSILFAGGIGVTPLLAMAEQLSRDGASFALHCSNRSAARIPFRERIEVSAFADRTHHHLDDTPHSRLDAAAVLARPDRRHTHLYVCGPQGFMDHILQTARAAGWADANLHFECFAAPAANVAADNAGFEVRLARRDLVISVAPDQSVAQALAGHGIQVPLSCEQGICGTCLMRVLDGVPDHRDSFLSDAEKAANDRFLPCCSRARSAHLLIDF